MRVTFKLIITVIMVFLASVILYQQIQISTLQNKIVALSGTKHDARYAGNPFTTAIYQGQIQTENLTFLHQYWYNPSTGNLINITDLAAYPLIPVSYLVWTDGALVYAKNGTTGQRVFTGDAYTVLNSIKNTLKASGGGVIFLYSGNYTLTSTFPDENVSSTIMMIGAGRSTRLLSSGAFNAVDPAKIQIRDLVWEDSTGTLHDASFDPNMFQQALRTELNQANITVIQTNYTQLLTTQVPPFYNKVKEGYAFSGSKRFTSIASDANFTVLFENPADSEKTAAILAIAVTGFVQCYVDIYENITVTSYGTSITIRNLNLSSTNTNICKVYYGGTYDLTNAIKVHETIVPGGSKKFAIGSSSEVGEAVIIPPGKSILIVVTNKGASAGDFSIQILWSEAVI